ncbi:hypothetical protein [Microvirga calopogonii]|uniref:hypothetical protein n=1 Tax=Microvirga calopogonii TaxID=2078013 RepID=UPI0013B3C10D|nr:hypothetical protein [Microvirga calopogonii]
MTRMVDYRHYVEGEDAENFVADIESMLARPDLLEERDPEKLTSLLHKGIAEDGAGNPFVFLSGKDWGRFVGIRKRFLANRRERLLEDLRSRSKSTKFIFPDF